MNRVEIVYKLMVDVILTALIAVFFFSEGGADEINATNLILSFLLAHTINWIINGQPVALLMHIDIGSNNAEYFIRYIERLEKRIKKKTYFAACASYGSLSVGNYNPKSDIDIRIIMKESLWSQVRTANFCFWERVRAFLSFFPLDLYAFTLEEVKRKMSPKEPPVIFSDAESILKDTYDDLISFDEFNDTFKRVVLKVSDN